MDDLIREINGLKEEIGWHDWKDLEADREYLGSRMVMVLDLMVAMMRNGQTVPEHQHRLHNYETYRTGPVIPHGY